MHCYGFYYIEVLHITVYALFLKATKIVSIRKRQKHHHHFSQ